MRNPNFSQPIGYKPYIIVSVINFTHIIAQVPISVIKFTPYSLIMLQCITILWGKLLKVNFMVR